MRINALIASLACLVALAAGGQTSGPWELESSGSTAGLRGIYNVGGGVVWTGGTGGTVLRSEDTGYLWQQCTTPPGAVKLDFRGIWAWDAENVLVLSSGPGDQSRLYQSTDGCSSWKLVMTNTDSAGFWDGILFFDGKRGVIYGDPVKDAAGDSVLPLHMTLDGGSTWKFDPSSPRALPGESIFAASNSAMSVQQGTVWLGMSKARVLRRTGTAPWERTQTPLASGNDSSGVFSVAFRDREHGIAVGGDYRKPAATSGTAAYTSDGGKHWGVPGKFPHGYRSAVAWDAQDQAWITVGSNGSDISYDDGATWQWLDGGNWNALSLPWAVGPNGQIGKLGTLPARHTKAADGVSR
ncbi:MAG: glycosyl hydrolase [Acidobacteriaceae bacterium]